MDVPTGMIRPYHSKLAFAFRLMDVALVVLSLWVAMALYGTHWNDQYLMISIIAVGAYSFFAGGFHAYQTLRCITPRQLVLPIILTWAATTFTLLTVAYFAKISGELSRVTLGIWFLLAPVLLIIARILVKRALAYARSKGFNTRRVAIIGAEKQGIQLAKTINDTPSFGMSLIGFFEDRSLSGGRVPSEVADQIKGNFDDLVQRARNQEVDLIYIAISLKGTERIAQLIDRLRDTTASVHLVPDFFVFDLLHSRWQNLGSIPTISIFESPFFGVDGWLKRLEDIVLSSIILTLIAVPMLFIAVGVKLSSPGPVLFKQRRYGLDGRAIRVWKFRTMTVCEDGDKVTQAKKNDTRITPFGAFLRRTSLDELPQFINVLMGSMSIVGPRPHAVAHNEEYRKLISGYMLRHKVPPGITGWAQVNGWRGETETLDKMKKRIEFDLWYIRSWSLWLDLKIIFRTIYTGFSGRQAY